jgi:hypothetical protein
VARSVAADSEQVAACVYIATVDGQHPDVIVQAIRERRPADAIPVGNAIDCLVAAVARPDAADLGESSPDVQLAPVCEQRTHMVVDATAHGEPLAASPQRQVIDGRIAAMAGSTTPLSKKLGLKLSDQAVVEMPGRLAAFRRSATFQERRRFAVCGPSAQVSVVPGPSGR